MDLTKMPAGKQITLKIKRESTVAEFNTSVIEHLGDCVVCDPIMHEGKMINFAIEGLHKELSVFDTDTNKFYAWKSIDVKAGYYKKKTLCHLIYLNAPPVEINRRSNYRQYVGLRCKVEFFHNGFAEATLRDVSNNGLGLIREKPDERFVVGKDARISFTDGSISFSLDATLVRARELENGLQEYGYQVINPPQKLAMYVAHKQLEERRRVLGY